MVSQRLLRVVSEVMMLAPALELALGLELVLELVPPTQLALTLHRLTGLSLLHA